MKKKQFAVIGLGRFGSNVARILFQQGYEVLAIDSREDRVKQLADVVTHVVQADTTDENSLKALGIRNFDVVVVAIGEDIQANTMTTLLLKEQGVPHIVAKARNELHGKMLQRIGADRVVYPERDMGARVAHNLVSTNVLDYIELSPDLSIVEIQTPQALVGQSLVDSNLRVRYEINVVAVKRGNEVFVPPRPADRLQSGDILVVVGANNGIRRLEELE